MLHKVHGPVPWVNPFTIRPFSSSITIIGTSDDREGYRGQYPPLRLYLGPDGRLALHPGYQSS